MDQEGQIIEERAIDEALLAKKTESEKTLADMKSGYIKQLEEKTKEEEQFFVSDLRDANDEIPDGMKCVICQGTVHQARFCPQCGNTVFCRVCVDGWKVMPGNDNKDKCPVCMGKLDAQELVPMMAQVFGKRVLMVPVEEGQEFALPEGTEVADGKCQMRYQDVQTFYRKTAKVSLACPQGCPATFERIYEAEEHFHTCEKGKRICRTCFEFIDNAEEIKHPGKHEETCPEVMMECPNNCGKSLKRKDFQKHNDEECTEGKVKCKKCGEIVLQRVLKEHQFDCLEKFYQKLTNQVQILSECQGSYNGSHALNMCNCSTYCSNCIEFLEKPDNALIHASACGLFCMECKAIIYKRHRGYTYKSDCSLYCLDCKEVHMGFGEHPVTLSPCGCGIMCTKCQIFENGGKGGYLSQTGCAYYYCANCKKINSEGHDIIGNVTCGLYCNTCSKQVYNNHDWIKHSNGCTFCKSCNKSIAPGHRVVGQYGCGLFCVDCMKCIYRNHSYFRATKCAILCDTDEHNKIYHQIKEGHTITRDGNRYWDCKECAVKLNYSDFDV